MPTVLETTVEVSVITLGSQTDQIVVFRTGCRRFEYHHCQLASLLVSSIKEVKRNEKEVHNELNTRFQSNRVGDNQPRAASLRSRFSEQGFKSETSYN